MDFSGKPTAQGVFSKTPFSHILIYLYSRQMSGTLIINTPKPSLIFFQKGNPAKIKIDKKSKGLGEILLGLGLIDQSQMARAKIEVEKTNKLLGQILVNNKIIDIKTLIRGLREQMLAKLVDFFKPDDSNYAFYQNQNLLIDYGSPELFPLDPFPLIAAGMRENDNIEEIDSVLKTLNGKWITVLEINNLKRFRFLNQEQNIIRKLVSNPSLYEDFLKHFESDGILVKKILYIFLISKQLNISTQKPKIKLPPTPNQPPPKPLRFESTPPQPPPPPSARGKETPEAALIAQINSIVAEMSSMDYYDMLGITSEASSSDVQKSFFKLAKKFHPDKASVKIGKEYEETLQYIFSNISEAHSCLIDPEMRQTYDVSLLQGQKRTSIVPPTGEENEVNDILEAENLYQKTMIMIRRKKYDKAFSYIDKACILQPHDGEYRAAWAYVQFLLRPADSPIEDLIGKLRHALEKNEKSERINYYLAIMLKRVGSYAQARLYFEKTALANPRNIEAARELRIMDMRKQKKPEEDNKKGFFKKLFK